MQVSTLYHVKKLNTSRTPPFLNGKDKFRDSWLHDEYCHNGRMYFQTDLITNK